MADASQSLLLGLVAVMLLGWMIPLVGFLVWQGLHDIRGHKKKEGA